MLKRVLQALTLLRRQASDRHVELPALPTRTARLFRMLSTHDQHHLIAVYRSLKDNGASDDLAFAGLLHDIGKASYSREAVGLVARTLNVLLASVPGLRRLIEHEGGAGIRGELWRTRHHAELGAVRLAALGWSPEVVRLVRAHESPGIDPALIQLRQADDDHG